MNPAINRKIILASRPVGEPADSDFRLVEDVIPQPGPDQVLLRTLYLSLDPYMRGRLSAAKSYAEPVALGGVIVGGTISRVVESPVAGLVPGDLVLGYAGWQDYAVAAAAGLQVIDPTLAPVTTALGVLGMPGMTAYCGLLNIGKPQRGETVVVAAASGAVGSVVGQIARLKGCRVVGIAGGARKCAFVVDELGFDACIDHQRPDFAVALASACPRGIDVYFENVGGAVFDAVLPLLNMFARVPVCGLIASYNATAEDATGPDRTRAVMRAILTHRLTFRGFIVSDYAAQRQEFLETVGAWVRDGSIRYREDIVEGLEQAPAAFRGLLRGANFGKLLVRVSAA
ncbi:MAG: NADP-dependent oxidoreductase [Azospirillaceae bacterium]|nr:NADP-dependent oxidoreductase [Azospirillaceae bacterium]